MIVKYPSKVLSTKASMPKIGFKDEELKKLVAKMKMAAFMCKGVGLAANQLGSSWPVFVFQTNNEWKTAINPALTILDETKVLASEGCLSIPGKEFPVFRASKVRLEYIDIFGNEHDEEYEGWDARIVQHEWDHLNGTVVIDRFAELTESLNNGTQSESGD